MAWSDQEQAWMQKALELARLGEGLVEPNPMVGCLIVSNNKLIGKGYHEKFGGPHAEVNALADAGEANGATAFVTLEPCSHHGKTPPCVDALIDAGIKRVVVAMEDPFAKVSGQGIKLLTDKGIEVSVGLCADDAAELNAPYLKRLKSGIPWVIAKWAMTLDGKIATHSGDSQWISNSDSRKVVHDLRGRVDAVIVGSGTAIADDPLLTARPAGKRTAMRVVLDSNGNIGLNSKLVLTAREAPVLVAVGPDADPTRCNQMKDSGCEIWKSESGDRNERLKELMLELGKRELTNVLVEGGSELLGSFRDLGLIDEVHVFMGAKMFGGSGLSPVAGTGITKVADGENFRLEALEAIGDDLYAVYRIIDQ